MQTWFWMDTAVKTAFAVSNITELPGITAAAPFPQNNGYSVTQANCLYMIGGTKSLINACRVNPKITIRKSIGSALYVSIARKHKTDRYHAPHNWHDATRLMFGVRTSGYAGHKVCLVRVSGISAGVAAKGEYCINAASLTFGDIANLIGKYKEGERNATIGPPINLPTNSTWSL